MIFQIKKYPWKDLLVTVFLFCAGILMTLTNSENIVSTGEASAVLGEITEETPVRQMLSYGKGKLSQIDMIFGTYARENSSSITLCLTDIEGTIYEKYVVPCNELIDNAVFLWKFRPVVVSTNNQIWLEITSSGIPGNAVTVYYDSTVEGQFTVGENILLGQLTLVQHYDGLETVFEYGLHPLLALVLLLVVYTVLFVISRYHKFPISMRALCIVSPCILVLFFSVPPTITYDSAHYLNYLPILSGERGFENWDIVRGPVFPMLLQFTTLLFGNDIQGLLSMQFLFFEGTLLCVFCILEQNTAGRKAPVWALLILSLLYIFNPIVSGGYHALLTEFPAAFFAVLSCAVTWNWLKLSGQLQIKDIAYVIYFLASAVLTWQLKQPYFGCVLYPLLAVAFITVVDHKEVHKQRIFFRLVMPVACLAGMLSSTFVWTSFIDSFGNMDETRTTTTLVQSAPISGLPLVKVGELSGNMIANELAIPASQQMKVNALAGDEAYDDNLYSVYELVTLKDGARSEYLVDFGGGTGVLSSIRLMLTCWQYYPSESFENYFWTFLKICNITRPNIDIVNAPSLDFQEGHGDEVAAIYYRPFNGNENVFYVDNSLRSAVATFHSSYIAPSAVSNVSIVNGILYADALFKSLMFFTPLVWFFLIVKIIKGRKKNLNNDNSYLQLILWTYSMGNLSLHVFIRATIDRYVFTNYMVVLISVALALQNHMRKTAKIC